MTTRSEDFDERQPEKQEHCKEYGVIRDTLPLLQMLAEGNETEFQCYMLLIIQQMTEHLGLSPSARAVKEEFLERRER